MPHYRVYALNPHNGHFDGVEDLQAANDVEATALVNRCRRSVPAEMWCGGRKVARFDAPPEMAAAVPGTR